MTTHATCKLWPLEPTILKGTGEPFFFSNIVSYVFAIKPVVKNGLRSFPRHNALRATYCYNFKGQNRLSLQRIYVSFNTLLAKNEQNEVVFAPTFSLLTPVSWKPIVASNFLQVYD